MPELASLFTLPAASARGYAAHTVDPVCTHTERSEGKCPTCGLCEHDLVLNGACYFCGETDLKVTIKPAQDNLVQLRPKRPSES